MTQKFFLSGLICSILSADSVNSPLKNPSMAVTGTPREVTPIVTTVIPAAIPGQACNSYTDTIAVTPDHTMELICYNNIWTITAVIQK